MIDVDVSRAKEFLTDSEFEEAQGKAEQSFRTVKNKTGKGAEWLGWRDMLNDPNDAILEQLDSLAARIRQDADVFILCGIGARILELVQLLMHSRTFLVITDQRYFMPDTI